MTIRVFARGRYRMRNGYPAVITGIVPHPRSTVFPLLGYYWDGRQWRVCPWTEAGMASTREECPIDLMPLAPVDPETEQGSDDLVTRLVELERESLSIVDRVVELERGETDHIEDLAHRADNTDLELRRLYRRVEQLAERIRSLHITEAD